MYRGLSVAVVVPAYNEERRIAGTVGVVPSFVDRVIIVDDGSRDRTGAWARRARRPGLEVVTHPANRGVGSAIVTGYRRVLSLGLDVACVMAGDGQMDPADLPLLLEPLVAGRADYAKGNRFRRADVWRAMPPSRLVGNVILSFLNKIVSGYWQVFDSQCGYTAITREALACLDLDRLFPRYGYPVDLLARLHAAGARVEDVAVRAVYDADWRSGICLCTVAHPILWVLLRAWTGRLAAEWRRARPLLGRSLDRRSSAAFEDGAAISLVDGVATPMSPLIPSKMSGRWGRAEP
jgi:glycosyltransferase involved in cell wall biosynthesis